MSASVPQIPRAKGFLSRLGEATTFKIFTSYVIGAVALAFCIISAWTQGPNPTFQVLVCILGGVLGWILGLFITPYSETEKKNFSDYGKTLTALASGFGLAKIDSIPALFRNIQPDVPTKDIVFWMLLFTCTFLIAALFTYISRLHVRDPDDDLRVQREKIYNEIVDALEKLNRIN